MEIAAKRARRAACALKTLTTSKARLSCPITCMLNVMSFLSPQIINFPRHPFLTWENGALCRGTAPQRGAGRRRRLAKTKDGEKASAREKGAEWA